MRWLILSLTLLAACGGGRERPGPVGGGCLSDEAVIATRTASCVLAAARAGCSEAWAVERAHACAADLVDDLCPALTATAASDACRARCIEARTACEIGSWLCDPGCSMDQCFSEC